MYLTGMTTKEDGHAHMSAYVYIETTTKIIQVPFESVPQV